MKSELDALFFDNDGVLVDTEPLFLRATRDLLATIAIEVDDATYREISLRQGRSVFDLAKDRGSNESEIESLRARRNDRYSELIKEGVATLDAVQRVVERLHGLHPMAIVTSSDRGHFDLIHAQTDLMRFFDFVLANDDYVRHKPHPEPYLMAAERLDVDPGRCLVIEDTERGLDAAHAAGMRCVVIPNALSAGGNFAKAEYVLDSMADLPALLGL